MKHLSKIARSATPSNGIQFRASAYGAKGIHDFLRDVIAIANASVDGARFIVVGAEFDAGGKKRLKGIDKKDFTGSPAYQSLASEFIEPPVRIRYQPVTVGDKRLGVYEIGDCQDRPYMMRVDHSESLRRGDAYMRLNDAPMKMGRRQLQALFEMKFRESVPALNVEIGFPGDIIHKDLHLSVCDLSLLPSAVAASKLKQLMEIKSGLATRGSTSRMARLTHARLFGTDDPYTDRSKDTLIEELRHIERQYADQDKHFMFEQEANNVQLVVYNPGDEDIRDASLSLVMPNHLSFRVAPQLPPLLRDNKFVERSSAEQDAYPAVILSDDAVQLSSKLGDIAAGACVNVFETPLRVCVGSDLRNRKFGVQYSLFAKNLRTTAKGKLRLRF